MTTATTAPAHDTDWLIVGGGIVGAAIAWGLARAGQRAMLLDEGDDAFRAARGNFGLVWVQGKGFGHPAYARWTLEAAAAWPAFAAELADRTGVDVELVRVGGMTMCLDDDELAARAGALASIRDAVGIDYPFEVLDPGALRERVPQAGRDLAGAVFCPLDGHVSPLRLLRALLQAFVDAGGVLHTGTRIDRIEARGGGFVAHAAARAYGAGRIVLAAGLGNRSLAPMVGLRAPVVPNRGQVLISERVRPFLRYPTLHVRQTGDGGVQIGDSKEDVGFDDGTTIDQLARITARALRCFPLLAGVNIVRSWGALRVMSPDGLPIYEASTRCPGAFVASCHSGITLAAQHAGALVAWMRGGAAPAALAAFGSERFDVQAA